MQEVQRAAGAAEFLATRQRAGLGGEAIEREALLAEAGCTFRLIVQVAAVQAAVHLRQLVVAVVDLEVAPRVVVVVRQLHVHLAERRRDLFHDRVVAERRIVIVRIDARNSESGALLRKLLNSSSTGPSRVSRSH